MSAEISGAVGLERSLTYWDLVLYGLAYIAPFAPLSTLGFVWNESGGLIVLAYVLKPSIGKNCTCRCEPKAIGDIFGENRAVSQARHLRLPYGAKLLYIIRTIRCKRC